MVCLDALASVFWSNKFGCVGASISIELMGMGGDIGASLFLIALGTLSFQHIFPFSVKTLFSKLKDSYFDTGYTRPIAIYSGSNRTWDAAMDRSWRAFPKNHFRRNPVHLRMKLKPV